MVPAASAPALAISVGSDAATGAVVVVSTEVIVVKAARQGQRRVCKGGQ